MICKYHIYYKGVGASRVRELFRKAREKAPSIIFIDEIDSVAGTRRTVDPSHSRDTINQILSEMVHFLKKKYFFPNFYK